MRLIRWRALVEQSPPVIWSTGLSGSGKSAIAKRVEQALHAAGRQIYSLTATTYDTGYAMTSASPSLTRWKNP
jgi:adenylylsulfate kinase-like enzyme